PRQSGWRVVWASLFQLPSATCTAFGGGRWTMRQTETSAATTPKTLPTPPCGMETRNSFCKRSSTADQVRVMDSSSERRVETSCSMTGGITQEDSFRRDQSVLRLVSGATTRDGTCGVALST